MASEKVGSLFVEVGVHGEQAILEATELQNKLTRIARQLNGLGTNADFNRVTKQLKAVNAEAQKTSDALAAATTAARTKSGPDPMAAIQAQAIAENERRKAAEATGAAAAKAAAAQAKAASDAQKAQEKAARQSMASMQKEAIAQNRAFDRQKRDAERAAEAQVRAQARASKQREMIMLREAHAMNRAFDSEARAAERAARREARAAELAAASRAGARRRAGADAATGAAAFATGNWAYGLANIAQGASKLTGAFKGATVGAIALKGGIIAVAAAAPLTIAALAGVGGKIAELGVQQSMQLEMLQIQYEGLLGSARAAKQEVDYVLQMGTESLVPTQDLLDANRLLLAYGATNTAMRHEMLEFMSAFATVTGASQVQLNNLAYAMGQIVSTGKVNAIDMRQLATAGISSASIYKEIAKQQKISVAEAKNWLSQGKLTADVVLPAILARTEKLDEAQKKARESSLGILANLKDIANVKMGEAFKGLADSLKPVLEWVQEFLKAFDFEYIGKAFQQVVGYFHEAFQGMGADASGTAKGISESIGKSVNLVGYMAVRIAQFVVAVFDTLMVVVNIVWMAIQGIVAAISKSVSILTGVAGAIPGPWQDAMQDVSTSTDNAAAAAANGAAIAANSWINGAGAAATAWANFYTQVPTFTEPNPDQYATGTPTANKWANFYNPTKPKPIQYPKPVGVTTQSTSGSSAEDKAIAAMKELIDLWKELVDQSIKGRDALRDAFTVPFAAAQPGATSAAFKAFSSGEVDTIVGQYKEIRQALEDYYALGEGRGSKKNRQAMRAQRKEDIAFLKQQTGELVRLAAEAKKINEDMEKAEEAYNKATEALQKQRDAQQRQYADQQKAIAKQYDDYYTATSATTGTFTKGAIRIAEEALEAATTAYDKAKEKLDELKAARDDFMSSLKEMAYSFVNDLSKVNEEITRFTRLDSIGSFSSVTEQVASTKSFTQGLKDRLQALKDFTANVKTLQTAGLDSGLLQQILLGGPEQSGALASSLAGASAEEIAEINRIQADLAATVGAAQGDASAAWFDAGIAAQEAFTAPLKAAMDAAQAQVTSLNEQKELALGILEAWNADQTAMYDERQALLDEAYAAQKEALETALAANQAEAEKVAMTIQTRLEGLPTTAYAQGMNTIQGLIDGLKDDAKLKELKAAAREMALVIKRTVNDTLGINSPSRVMAESGYNIGLGLAQGMNLSEPIVSDASLGLANAAIGAIGSDGASMGGGDTLVKVFIGERELTDIVDYQIEKADAASGSFVMTGRRL